MKSKIMKNVLSGILSVSLMFQMSMSVVYADSGQMPSVNDRFIYANGTPLLIVGDGRGTTIYIDTNANGVLDDGEKSLKYAGISGGPANGADLSCYCIFGGSNRTDVQYNTHIVMTGGYISSLYGGCDAGYDAKGGSLTGDTYIKVTGGEINGYLLGGSSDTTRETLTGNTTVIVTGGTASYNVSGGCFRGTVTGTKTGIVTSTKAYETGFHNGFLKTGTDTYIAKGTITLPSDFDFTLPTGATLTVQEGAVITNQGKITLNGAMVNNGNFINNGAVKNEGGSYSGSGTWNGNAIEDLNLTLLTAKEITDSSVKFTVNCNKDATVYYLASETPISDTSTLETKGNSKSISANTDTDIELANLTDNTSYTYYMMAKAGEKFTDIKAVSFTTLQKSPLSGTGTQTDPYIIETDDGLLYLANSVRAGQNYSGKYFKLNNDITYSSMPIGCFSENGNINSPFCGNFDGEGHTVTLAMTNTSSGMEQAVALFGYLGSGASVKNIGTTGTITSSGKFSGGIAGVARDGAVNISNCSSNVEMNFTTGGDCTYGGIVGLINNSGNVTMTNCCFTGKIITSSGKGLEGVGGLCGWNSDTLNAANCYVDASFGSSSITAKGEYMARNGGSFTNCYYNKDKTLTDDGSTNSTGTEAVASDFTSGKIDWLLQNGQPNSAVQVWGQTLIGDTKDSDPVLSSDSAKAVHKVSYYQDNKELENIRGYVNSSMTLPNFTLTEEEINEGYKYNFEITSGIAALDTANNQLKDIVGDVIVTVKKEISDEQLGMASITVDGGSSYTINGSEYTAPNTGKYSLGTNVTVAVSDGADFAYWVNDYGKIVSRDASYTFTVTGSMTLTAVYNQKEENKSTVIFESYYGQVMSRIQLGSDDTVTLPEGPTRYGYTFTGWSMTVEEIQNQISAGTAEIKVIPVYELIEQSYTITVTGGVGSGNYNLNDLVTVTAKAPEAGMKFSHWTDKNGNILSYSTTYQFYATKDVTITANYVAKTSAVEAKGIAEIIDINKDTENSKIIFVSMVTVPEGCKIQMAGVIGTDNETVGKSGDGFNKNTATYVRGNAWSGNAYRFTWTKKASADETWYVRAYLVYKDTNGNLITVYGDMMSAGLNN